MTKEEIRRLERKLDQAESSLSEVRDALREDSSGRSPCRDGYHFVRDGQRCAYCDALPPYSFTLVEAPLWCAV